MVIGTLSRKVSSSNIGFFVIIQFVVITLKPGVKIAKMKIKNISKLTLKGKKFFFYYLKTLHLEQNFSFIYRKMIAFIDFIKIVCNLIYLFKILEYSDVKFNFPSSLCLV